MSNPAPTRVMRCRQCGYDLQGIPSHGRCPECGEEVDPSLTAAALLSAGELVAIQLSNRRWVRAVRRGAGAMVLGAIAVNLMGLLLMFRGNGFEWVQAAAIALLLLAMVLLTAGAGLVSAREPYTGGPAPMRATRLLIRVGIVVFFMSMFLPFWLPLRSRTIWVRLYPYVFDFSALLSTVPALWLASILAKRSGSLMTAPFTLLCIGAVVVSAAIEASMGSVPVGGNVYQGLSNLPFLGDAGALAALLATERYRPRVDTLVVAIVFHATVSIAVTAVWAKLWASLARSTSVSASTPAGAATLGSDATRRN